MSTIFSDAFRWLEPDLFNIIVPFILIFTVMFAILQKVNLFAKDNDEDSKKAGKRFNAGIALAISLIVIGQHIFYPGNTYDIIPVLMSSLPQVALVLVAIVMAMTFLGLIGGKNQIDSSKGFGGLVNVIAIVVILFIFGSNYGMNLYNISRWFDRSVIMSVLAIVVFIVIVKMIIGGDSSGSEPKKSVLDRLSETFK